MLTGSHMDSQPNFDDIWGVIAGLEAVQALREATISTKRSIEFIAWTHDQGGRYAPGREGSTAYAGYLPADTWDAIPFGEALAQHLASENDIKQRGLGVLKGQAPFGYVELHIEQGPTLESKDADIGIQGGRCYIVGITGKSDHAGTTPFRLRKDAMQDMLRAFTALNALMHDATDTLRLTIDLRRPDNAVLQPRGNAIEGVIQAARRDCAAQVTERFNAAPSVFAPLVPEAAERAARAQRFRALRLPSGAFHDAQFLHPLCPTGMIFGPCSGGVSHHPPEYSEPTELAAGMRVLAQVPAELAND